MVITIVFNNSALAESPLLSVVIPTCRRSDWLARAIDSGLKAAPHGSVEVIVVPNGQDQGWRNTKIRFASESRVRWHPLEMGGVSAARNHGLALSHGTFIRFLDDDDYLYAETSRKQCESLIAQNADVCSGAVDVVRQNGARISIRLQPSTSDFCAAALNPGQHVQVGCHVYRRAAVQGIQWNETCSLYEDVEWQIAVASSRELMWIRTDDIVAAWTQHRRHRLSKGRDPGAEPLKHAAQVLIRAACELDASRRLNKQRRQSLADGLWGLLQKGLRYDRKFWYHVSDIANFYMPGRRPPSRIHKLSITKKISPLVIENILIPVRFGYSPVRRILARLGIDRV